MYALPNGVERISIEIIEIERWKTIEPEFIGRTRDLTLYFLVD
jgi:hypothetical protein